MTAWGMAWKAGCILICGSVAVGLLLAVAAEWLSWRARPRHAMDQAVVAVRKPCNGEAGRCTCPVKCAHPQCAARDTVISDKQFAEELAELLRKEEHRD